MLKVVLIIIAIFPDMSLYNNITYKICPVKINRSKGINTETEQSLHFCMPEVIRPTVLDIKLTLDAPANI